MSESSRPHGLQPTRLLHPWDPPGKSTGVGCHCPLHLLSLAFRKYQRLQEFCAQLQNENQIYIIYYILISLPLSWNDLLLYCFRYLSLLIVLFSVICGGGLVVQSCLTLGDSTDCSLPGSSVHGILQARILEGIIISFSKGTSWPRDQTQVSYIVVSLLHCRRILYQLSHLSWWTVISSKLLSLIWV